MDQIASIRAAVAADAKRLPPTWHASVKHLPNEDGVLFLAVDVWNDAGTYQMAVGIAPPQGEEEARRAFSRAVDFLASANPELLSAASASPT